MTIFGGNKKIIRLHERPWVKYDLTCCNIILFTLIIDIPCNGC